MVWLKIFLIAATPLFELRGALPLAIKAYHLPVIPSFIVSFLGNIFAVSVFLFFLNLAFEKLRNKNRFFKSILDWIYKKTEKKHKKKFELWENFALIILVAIPLPLTGGWTGALCAFIFGIPAKKAIPLIAIGLLIAELIVLALIQGAYLLI